ncbi:MAG: cyclic nucleotide-binding domain-containing protein, partial [Magnetococcales bacterium]|nr:cyclic nucleotide-binding domain-containing protein [Magnetococcales bacterium]
PAAAENAPKDLAIFGRIIPLFASAPLTEEKGVALIGRFEPSDILLADFCISRRHALIAREEEGYVIRDCASRFGSAVNGVNCGAEMIFLHDRDEVRLGRYLFHFLTPDTLHQLLTEPQRDDIENGQPMHPDRPASQVPLDAMQAPPAPPTPLDTHLGSIRNGRPVSHPDNLGAPLPSDRVGHKRRVESQSEPGRAGGNETPPCPVDDPFPGMSPETRQHAELMTLLPFFKNFADPEIERMAGEHTQFRKYRSLESIVREGEASTGFHILLRGEASVLCQGSTQPIATLHPGNCFGEVSFLTGERRSATVMANDRVTTLLVDRPLLARLPTPTREKFKDQIIKQLLVYLDQQNYQLVRFRSSLAFFIRYREGFRADSGEEADNPGRPSLLEPSRLHTLLAANPIFRSFLETTGGALALLTRSVRIFAKDEVIVSQGRIGHSLYLLLSGRVRVGTRECAYPLAFLDPGQFFGEVSFLLSRPRSVDVTANGEVAVLRLDNANMGRLPSALRENLKDWILDGLLRRLTEQNAKLTTYRRSFRFYY